MPPTTVISPSSNALRGASGIGGTGILPWGFPASTLRRET